MTVKYRDAVTGEYVTQEYAEAHPRRTVAETVKDEPEQAEQAEQAEQPEEEE